MTTTPTLFLSGAGLPEWIWDEVRSLLPGESRVAAYPRGDATLDDYAAAGLAAAEGWEGFQVVAHSIGGVVAGALLARAPQRVSRLVAVSASVPSAGSSFLGALPPPRRQVMSLVVRLLGTRPPDSEIRNGLCRGVAAETADRIVAEFEPESKRLYRDRVPPRRVPAATTYVLTTDDTQFEPALQEKYAAELGGDVQRLATAHLPMLQAPTELVELIG